LNEKDRVNKKLPGFKSFEAGQKAAADCFAKSLFRRSCPHSPNPLRLMLSSGNAEIYIDSRRFGS